MSKFKTTNTTVIDDTTPAENSKDSPPKAALGTYTIVIREAPSIGLLGRFELESHFLEDSGRKEPRLWTASKGSHISTKIVEATNIKAVNKMARAYSADGSTVNIEDQTSIGLHKLLCVAMWSHQWTDDTTGFRYLSWVGKLDEAIPTPPPEPQASLDPKEPPQWFKELYEKHVGRKAVSSSTDIEQLMVIKELSEQVKDLRRDKRDLTEQLSDADETISDLKDNLEQANRTIAGTEEYYKGKTDHYDETIETLQEDLASAREDITNHVDQYQEAMALFKATETELEDYRGKLAETKELLTIARVQRRSTQMVFNAKTEECFQAKARVMQLEAELDKFRQRRIDAERILGRKFYDSEPNCRYGGPSVKFDKPIKRGGK